MTMARPLWKLAWLNAMVHGIALVAAYFGMRPGSPLVALPERLHYLSHHSAGWIIGWSTWVVSALVMLGFTMALARRLHGTTAKLAVGIALAAVALDLSCDAVYLGVFPWLAAQSFPDYVFLTVERTTNTLSLGVANTFYSVAVLLLTLALDREASLRGAIVLGCAVFCFGLLLSAAGFTAVPMHAQWATAPTIVGYTIWSLWVAAVLDRRRPTP